MDISASTALVTGANRGFGQALAAELISRGARVYAGARDPASVSLPGAIPVALDITDPASVAAAADSRRPTSRSWSTTRASAPGRHCWTATWSSSGWKWTRISSARSR